MYFSLRSHLKNDNGGSCGAQLKSAAAIHAAERAENLVQQELRSQRKSGVVIRKKLNNVEDTLPRTKVTAISYMMTRGRQGFYAEMRLEIPKDDKAWTVWRLYLDDVRISIFNLTIVGVTATLALCRLTFTQVYAIPNDFTITANVNLTGDLNCYTYGTIVFKPVSPVSGIPMFFTQADCLYNTFDFVDIS
ncbi:hypothetical protein IFR05_011379 [Cadophora sp. M221]|nr:hypothetical protein IFR05_011379 [Cadophora sp. M221]